jgi:hypothetical protein
MIKLNDCCDTPEISTGYLQSGKPYICCLGCNLVMLAPDLINNDAKTRFFAADALIVKWNNKHARGTIPSLSFEDIEHLQARGRRSRKSKRKREMEF